MDRFDTLPVPVCHGEASWTMKFKGVNTESTDKKNPRHVNPVSVPRESRCLLQDRVWLPTTLHSIPNLVVGFYLDVFSLLIYSLFC